MLLLRVCGGCPFVVSRGFAPGAVPCAPCSCRAPRARTVRVKACLRPWIQHLEVESWQQIKPRSLTSASEPPTVDAYCGSSVVSRTGTVSLSGAEASLRLLQHRMIPRSKPAPTGLVPKPGNAFDASTLEYRFPLPTRKAVYVSRLISFFIRCPCYVGTSIFSWNFVVWGGCVGPIVMCEKEARDHGRSRRCEVTLHTF